MHCVYCMKPPEHVYSFKGAPACTNNDDMTICMERQTGQPEVYIYIYNYVHFFETCNFGVQDRINIMGDLYISILALLYLIPTEDLAGQLLFSTNSLQYLQT